MRKKIKSIYNRKSNGLKIIKSKKISTMQVNIEKIKIGKKHWNIEQNLMLLWLVINLSKTDKENITNNRINKIVVGIITNNEIIMPTKLNI